MTREELRDYVDEQITLNNIPYHVYSELIDGIDALEQEPKTVLYIGDGYADGYMVYDMAECPNCGYEYEDGDKDWGLSFCPSCGQKLNWESEDKEKE